MTMLRRYLPGAVAAALLCLVAADMARAERMSPLRREAVVDADPAAGRLSVVDRLPLPAGTADLRLAAPLEISAVTVDGEPLAFRRAGDRLRFTVPAAPDERAVVEIRYAGDLPPIAPGRPAAMLGGEGAFLPFGTGWLPEPPGRPPAWRMEVRVPPPFVAVATGRPISDRGERGRAVFAEPRPVEGPSLFVGIWDVEERIARDGVRLRTYFEPGNAALARDFLDLSERLVGHYARTVGAYPFDGFAVVAAPLPVGLGFPGIAYIGSRILPLPFVRNHSLAHEILHNWWGNGIGVDGGGNWAEGLTTYMADHALAEARGEAEARAMRLAWLRDYAALPAGRDRPLSAFVTKAHDADQVVGYGKAAFVFHMLRRELGDDAFGRAIRLFWEANRGGAAGWDDLRQAFERASGRDLGAVFEQWLERPGAPSLHLESVRRDGRTVEIELRQDPPFYDLKVPVAIETTTGTEHRTMRIEGERARVGFAVDGVPRAVAVDPDHDLFRRLAPGEAPPILRDVTLATDAGLVIAAEPGTATQAALRVARGLLGDAARPVPAGGVPATAPLLVVGTPARVAAVLAPLGLDGPPPEIADTGGTAHVWVRRDRHGRAVLAVSAEDAPSLDALARPLPHYGRQSFLVFEGGRAVERGVWPAAGLRREVPAE